ncbi:MAG: N-acetylmuramidase domain-containing protein [Pseudomonadota bacterium]
MTKGVFIGFRGIGGKLWSDGIDELALALQDQFGWKVAVFNHTRVDWAVRQFSDVTEPLVLIWHSAGKEAASEFARVTGLKIDLGISVDAWLPGEMPGNFERIISVKADAFGRFHVRGGKVNQHIVIEDTTHTTVDDAEKLHDLVKREIAKLSGSNVAKIVDPDQPFYIGEGRQLDEAELVSLAIKHQIPPYLALAATHVETPELEGSWSSGALVTLWEDHVTYRNTSGQLRNRLVNERLAARGWRDLPYPKSPYPSIDRVAAIAGEEVAALSCSWGLFQILGENHRALGFASALEMVRWLAESEHNQFVGWVRFIDSLGLRDALLNEDWHAYSRRYNGSRYAEHDYHGRLSRQANKSAGKYGKGMPVIPDPKTNPLPPVSVTAQDQQLATLRKISTDKLIELIRNATIVLDERYIPEKGSVMAFKGKKPLYKSKTILGIVLLAIAGIYPPAGHVIDMFIPNGSDGAAELQQGIQQLVTAINTTLAAGGALLATWGRLKANEEITLP